MILFKRGFTLGSHEHAFKKTFDGLDAIEAWVLCHRLGPLSRAAKFGSCSKGFDFLEKKGENLFLGHAAVKSPFFNLVKTKVMSGALIARVSKFWNKTLEIRSICHRF